jgi:low temperature requirement protein LtrA
VVSETAPRRRRRPRDDDRRVGVLELFFDLVYVYAMSQVTTLVLLDVSWTGFARAVLMLAAIWWAWENYAWLTNTFERADPLARILIFLAMVAMLIAATALPAAFGEMALVFAVAYVVVRVLHVVLLAHAVRDDEKLHNAKWALAPILLLGSGLIIGAAFLESPYRELLWLISAMVDFGTPLVRSLRGWRVAPSYFVERHGNIVIIALGEAIVRMGQGAATGLHDPVTAVAVTMAVLIAAGMWWAYFEPVPHAVERLRRTDPVLRAHHARDAYSYLHLPLITGIVFFAIGVDEAVAHPEEPLALLSGVALAGGLALFYLGELAYRWRDHHKLMVDRLDAGAAAAAVILIADRVPALATLGVLLLISALRVAWEIRAGILSDSPARLVRGRPSWTRSR